MTQLRANRKMREFNQEKAEVGIGTMIVFIATVLVAAIAAGVLLDTSGKLQERSSKTGNAATEKVSSSIKVDSIIGVRNATGDTGLKYIEFFVSLAPGAPAIDLSQLKLTMLTNDYHRWLNHTTDPYANANQFISSPVRDSDSSLDSNVMNEGDGARILVDCVDSACEFDARTQVTVSFQPEVGVETQVGFSTPAAYGTDLRHKLV